MGDWSRTLSFSTDWPDIRALEALLAHGQELVLALPPQGIGIELRELVQRLAQYLAHGVDRLVGRAMGATHRLGNDLVDDLELLEVARRHLHRLGGVLRIGVVAP